MDSFGSASRTASRPTLPSGLTAAELLRSAKSARLAWLTLLIAAIMFALAVYLDLRSPALGFTVDPDGSVTHVDRGSDAYEAGVRPGDLVREINGIPLDIGRNPLRNVAANQPVLIRLSGAQGDRDLLISPASKVVTRIRALAHDDGAAIMRALSSLLRIVVNLWMLALAGLILLNRPEARDARLAAITLACWVGGNDIASVPGAHAFLSEISFPVEFLVYAVDLAFLCFFFVAALSFALVFPVPFRFVRRNPWSLAFAWVAIAPLVAVSISGLIRLLADAPPLRQGRVVFELWGATLLVIQVALLVMHFATSLDLNDRRRIRFVLASTLPGLIAWIIDIAVSNADASAAANAAAGLLRWIGAGVGGGIFAYALARERLFEMRPFLRQSIRYLFARGTLYFLMSLPAVILVAILWTRRHDSLAEIVNSRFVILGSLILAIAVILRFRRRLVEGLDRRFFSETWQAHNALLRIASVLQHGSDPEVVGRVAVSEIDRALAPGAIAWYREDQDTFSLAAGIGTTPSSCPCTELIAALADSDVTALQLDRQGAGILSRLSDTERQWIEASGYVLVLPIRVEEAVAGVIFLAARSSDQPYSRDDIHVMSVLAAQIAITESYARLEQLARRDALTDALNRHSFDAMIESRAALGIQRGCVAVVDLDGLKQINDTFGHAAGDRAIRRVAVALRTRLLPEDLLFRWGGDEFVVLFFGRQSAEVDSRVAELKEILRSHTGPPLQVSVGLADFDNVAQIASALEEADQRMYERKTAGRNMRSRGTPPGIGVL